VAGKVCGVDAAQARRLAERLADPRRSVVFVYDLDSASDRSEGDWSRSPTCCC
jgi:anaerobic selenocysteine-containing dehydrogenase